mmetsp:Transcript_49800/g.97655  ORF Transcript_49800/g.97655 Transcript_49800/m.97655 type:complete len:92 (-) Transcript_49800:560-835(-)
MVSGISYQQLAVFLLETYDNLPAEFQVSSFKCDIDSRTQQQIFEKVNTKLMDFILLLEHKLEQAFKVQIAAGSTSASLFTIKIAVKSHCRR